MIYIDVSHYDWNRNKGNLDWAQIKASGIDVVIIRASYGDPKIYNPETRFFKDMALAAKAAGLRVGGYHNLINGDFASIQRQVVYFKEQLDSVNADYAMVDVEPYQALRDNDLWPRLAAAELFAQEFRQKDIRRLAVYLPQWVWANWLDKADLRTLINAAGGPLVASNYPLGTTKGEYKELYAQVGADSGKGWASYGNVAPKIWQYSSNASVPGTSSVTDVNAFRGTLEELDSEMAWVLTRNLQAFRDQMNEVFPNRGKQSDGTIGDAAHAAGKSGHNPDDSEFNNAEWDGDSDTKSEVRAIDIDSDTGNPDVSMEDILQHLLNRAKADSSFPIRYMIYNKRIYRKTNGWAKEAYDGPSPHTEHIHLSGDYSNTADENYYDYRLEDLVALTDSDKTWINDRLNSFFAITTQGDGSETPTSRIGRDAWNQGIPNGVTGTKTVAYTALKNIGETVKAISTVLQTVVTKVDLDPAELAAIKTTLAVPTAEQNAAAVIAALGDTEIPTLVEVLQNGLSSDKLAALKAAL